ncbi:hypothetical protein MPER_07824, partial [Moniliophthora perniciosa FA553]
MTALRYTTRLTILKELADITTNPLEGLIVEAKDDNLFEWSCAIVAAVEPPDSPYKGGTYRFTLTLPNNFPFKAPADSG